MKILKNYGDEWPQVAKSLFSYIRSFRVRAKGWRRNLASAAGRDARYETGTRMHIRRDREQVRDMVRFLREALGLRMPDARWARPRIEYRAIPQTVPRVEVGA